MTAIIAVQKRASILMATDTASFDPNDGTIVSLNSSKTTTIPSFNAVIAAAGKTRISRDMDRMIPDLFRDFDQMVEDPHTLTEIFYAVLTASDIDAATRMVIAGFNRRPWLGSIEFWNDGSERAAKYSDPRKRGNLSQILYSVTPAISYESAVRFGFRFPEMLSGDDFDVEQVETLDLVHLMEIQRREETPPKLGGKVVITQVSEVGITHCVCHRWPEDEIGKPVKPVPIDWTRYRSHRAAPHTHPAGMSKLKRDMAERKARKLRR